MRRADFDPHLIDYQAPPEDRTLRRPDRHRPHHRVPGVGRGPHDQRRRAHRRRRDAGMILDVLARHVATRGRASVPSPRGSRPSPMRSSIASRTAPAHALRGLGVGRGDRVTLALGNSLEYVVAAFGVLKAGAVLNPVNPGTRARRAALHSRSCRAARRRDRCGAATRTAARRSACARSASAERARRRAARDGARTSAHRRRRRLDAALHVGHDGQAEGRALHATAAPATSGPHFIDALGLGARRLDPRGDAALPRQRLGRGRRRRCTPARRSRSRRRSTRPSSGRWCTRRGATVRLHARHGPRDAAHAGAVATLERDASAARDPRARQRADPRRG